MIDILTQKLQWCIENDVWNSDDSENSSLLISPKKDIAVAWTRTGFYEAQREKITFNNCATGHTYCLRKNGTLHEWTKFQKWYLEGDNTSLFRTDTPITRTEIEIDGETWDYTRWMRPGSGIGKTNSQTNISEVPGHMMNIIDIYYDAVASLIKVARAYNEETIPDLSFRHLMIDDKGYYFVKNFNLWDQTPKKVVTTSITFGIMLIQATNSLPSDFLDEWSTKATEKWSALYE
jgi:hypothetical protein